MDGFFSVILKVVYFLIVFGIIVLLAYFTSRVLGKRVSVNAGKYMRIVDTLFIGSDRALFIVQVKNEFLLMASSVKGIDILKKLDDFSENEIKTEGGFEDYLKEYGIHRKIRFGILDLIRKPKSGRDDIDEE